MTKKHYIIYFLIALVNTLVMRFVPVYIFVFLVILLLGVAMFGAIIVMDILGKTHYWVGAFYVLVLGILSLIGGMGYFG